MPMKKDPGERFGKVIGNIDGGVDPFQVDEVALDSIAQCKEFDINMPGASCRLWGIAHGCTLIVVFIRDGCSLLLDVKVPEDAADKERHAANVTGSHKFCFGDRDGNCWLEFSFYAMVPPVSWIQMPLKEQHVLTQVAQSKLP